VVINHTAPPIGMSPSKERYMLLSQLYDRIGFCSMIVPLQWNVSLASESKMIRYSGRFNNVLSRDGVTIDGVGVTIYCTLTDRNYK
jgi:hypothetical protein